MATFRLLLVVAVAVADPAKVAVAPLLGAVNVTVQPAHGVIGDVQHCGLQSRRKGRGKARSGACLAVAAMLAAMPGDRAEVYVSLI